MLHRRLVTWILSIAVMGLLPTLADAESSPSAHEILQLYLRIPVNDLEPGVSTRGARLELLRQLRSAPNEAVPEIVELLPTVQSPVQRLELLETIGWLPTPEAAELLASHLEDPDPEVRVMAVRGLRRHASRILRRGVANVPREPEFPPQVEGLVPHLIQAANDESASVRFAALWALADTRSIEGAHEIRAHLKDPEENIRFTAACLLTEIGDDSGLQELGLALQKMTATGRSVGVGSAIRAEHLMVSLARITEDNPGPPPMQPALSSSMVRMQELQAEYEALLQEWAAWWTEHQPTRKP